MSIANSGVRSLFMQIFVVYILLFILAEKKQVHDQAEMEVDNPGGSQDFQINSGVETQS